MAVCGWCDQEMNDGVPCTENKLSFSDGTSGPPRPYGVEKPPAFGVPLRVDLNRPWSIPDWFYADIDPKGNLVRVNVLWERGTKNKEDRGYLYYPWETRAEAEARRDALMAEHGYLMPGSDPGAPGADWQAAYAARMQAGVIVIEEPFCHDCKTPVGGFHHPGCDNEKCPRCSWQLISCGHLSNDEEDAEDGGENDDGDSEESDENTRDGDAT